MDAVELLHKAQADGVVVHVVDSELEIEADEDKRHWLAKLRPHKPAILRHLKGEPDEAQLPDSPMSPADGYGPSLVCFADVDPRPINWLWRGRIARGRITLLVGRPGEGKSFVTCDLASRISTGTPWPDGEPCERGTVIFITAEDDPHDTIRPRLDAHSADVNNIHLLKGSQRVENGKTTELIFTLSDVEILEQALRQVPDCRLIVIDPIGSFLGGRCDAHRDNEVRSVLAPIAKLAEQRGAAVLMVAHRRKGTAQSADDTALGSRAFTGLARSVWHLSRDPDDDQRRLLLPGKSNLAASTTGLAFTIAGEPASVHWDDEPVQMSADDALARETGNATGEMSALDEAVAWLAEYLATGPHPGKAVRKAAEADGIANRTLDRARGKLRVIAEPDGFGGPWVWRLPDDPATDCANNAPESTEYAKENALAHTGETVAHSGETDVPACSRCGSIVLREVPIHDGRSIRRDCSCCGKTVDFSVWQPA
ncbi:AAA family ATPase [Aeoliella sp. ICT_H6.2]|uniref:AAA family ATPase n=1 Tax=Aeoliella straminimaris TaxID=2954799 RepID=A0A9X2JJA1_9BACT|nr:AAA family ATPase [Aeoliella straminimaris]MCO6047950.1 AAA family ATPase [Aeoliella straminimaris]